MNPWDCKPMGREGGAFEGASGHAGKLTRGDLEAHVHVVSPASPYQRAPPWRPAYGGRPARHRPP